MTNTFNTSHWASDSCVSCQVPLHYRWSVSNWPPVWQGMVPLSGPSHLKGLSCTCHQRFKLAGTCYSCCLVKITSKYDCVFPLHSACFILGRVYQAGGKGFPPFHCNSATTQLRQEGTHQEENGISRWSALLTGQAIPGMAT